MPYRLRSCPRCEGTCYRDGDGWTCLRCGWVEPPKELLGEHDHFTHGPADGLAGNRPEGRRGHGGPRHSGKAL